MPTWPATLPQDAFIGTTDQQQDSVARTTMDAGPPSRRSRFTATTRAIDVPMILTGTQRAAFDAFFRDDLALGALAFDWEDPATDATVSFAFRSPPKWILRRGGPTPAERIFETQLELEIQP